MADNSVADPGAGGDTFRTKDRTTAKTQIVGLDLSPGSGSETLMTGAMPVTDNSGSLTVDNAGTFAVQADTELTTADLDTGAGTDTRAVVGLVKAASGGAVNISTSNPLPINGTVDALADFQYPDGGVGLPSSTAVVSGYDGANVRAVATNAAGVLAVQDNGTTLSVDDGAGSLTVDGTVTVQDGGGSVTVDNAGTFAVQIAANSSVNNAQVAGTATSVNSGAKDAGTQRVILASDQTVVPVSDNSGSLTVDAPVGTPAFVRLSDGAAAITALPVTDNSGSLTVDNAGTFAVQIAANSSVNVAQMAGTTTDTNSGVKSAGTQRVVLATDQPQLTNALKVDGSAVTQPVSATNLSTNMAQVAGTTTSVNSGVKDAGTQRVILASDQTVVPISDNSGSLTVDAPVATPVFVRLSDGTSAITTLAVSLATLPALTAGTAQVGTVGITPQTTGGFATPFHLVSASSTNATNVKASAGQLFGWYIRNTSAGDRKVAFHNTAGTPTAGAGVVFSINLPAGAGANVFNDIGIPFATGIAITTVTGTADSDTSAVTANDLDINLFYK